MSQELKQSTCSEDCEILANELRKYTWWLIPIAFVVPIELSLFVLFSLTATTQPQTPVNVKVKSESGVVSGVIVNDHVLTHPLVLGSPQKFEVEFPDGSKKAAFLSDKILLKLSATTQSED